MVFVLVLVIKIALEGLPNFSALETNTPTLPTFRSSFCYV